MSPLAPPEPTFAPTGGGASVLDLPAQTGRPAVRARNDDSLFERFPGVYGFFRERCFRDDTARIIQALWGDTPPSTGTQLIELGCGPGFYSSRIGARFPQISVTGVDCSTRQLEWARKKAGRLALSNCRFQADDVLDLSYRNESQDVVLAARLFTVLPNPQRAIAEMHRILRPGGKCLIAEPRYAFWASLPLRVMWLLARLTRMHNGCREPGNAIVLSPGEFRGLFTTQPWASMRTWHDGRYQYALCEKA
jgi:SAM-dependent methyltransferase